MTTAPATHKAPHRWPMILIAISKILKATVLLALGFGVHYFLAPASHDKLVDYVNWARLDPHNHYLYLAIEKLLAISPGKLQAFRIGFFIYSFLYYLEGVGILYDKHWAEWLVILTTAGFIPIEIYEMFHHFTFGKLAVFVVNLVIMAYLCFRLKRQATIKREQTANVRTAEF